MIYVETLAQVKMNLNAHKYQLYLKNYQGYTKKNILGFFIIHVRVTYDFFQ